MPCILWPTQSGAPDTLARNWNLTFASEAVKVEAPASLPKHAAIMILTGPLVMTLFTRRKIVVCFVATVLAGLPSRTVSQESPAAKPAMQNTLEAHLGRGYDALKQDRYDAAVSEFRAALELDPKLVLKARFPLAVALFEMHKFDEAHREFESVRREVGDHPNILYYLGRLDIESRNFE